MKFCIRLSWKQVRAGRYFMHEHPWGASSWKNKKTQEVMNMDGVQVVKGNMCRFGMGIKEEGQEYAVSKPTGFMTNAPCIAERLHKECSRDHEHVRLI